MPKYRRVEVTTTDSWEGWYHDTTTDGYSIVEDEDGIIQLVPCNFVRFITPPNVDLDRVCGTCGRMMGYACGVEHFVCINTKCHEFQEVEVTPEQAYIDDELGGE